MAKKLHNVCAKHSSSIVHCPPRHPVFTHCSSTTHSLITSTLLLSHSFTHNLHVSPHSLIHSLHAHFSSLTHSLITSTLLLTHSFTHNLHTSPLSLIHSLPPHFSSLTHSLITSILLLTHSFTHYLHTSHSLIHSLRPHFSSLTHSLITSTLLLTHSLPSQAPCPVYCSSLTPSGCTYRSYAHCHLPSCRMHPQTVTLTRCFPRHVRGDLLPEARVRGGDGVVGLVEGGHLGGVPTISLNGGAQRERSRIERQLNRGCRAVPHTQGSCADKMRNRLRVKRQLSRGCRAAPH